MDITITINMDLLLDLTSVIITLIIVKQSK